LHQRRQILLQFQLILKILQHSSTLLGGLVIALSLFKLPADKKVTGELNIKYCSILTGLTLTIIAIRLLSGLDYKLYGHVIVTSISAGLIALTLTPLITEKIRKQVVTLGIKHRAVSNFRKFRAFIKLWFRGTVTSSDMPYVSYSRPLRIKMKEKTYNKSLHL